MSYDQDLKNKWDNYSAFAYAREEGIQEGKRRKAISIARELNRMGLPLHQISTFPGLIIEQLADL